MMARFLSEDGLAALWSRIKAVFYSRSQIDGLLASIGKFAYKVVTELPEASSATTGSVYLIATDTDGVYSQWVTAKVDDTYEWRSLGTTSIDLTDYAKKSDTVYLSQDEYDALVSAGTVQSDVEYNILED